MRSPTLLSPTSLSQISPGFLLTPPNSGGQTLYIQYQAIDGFTPLSGSTGSALPADGRRLQ